MKNINLRKIKEEIESDKRSLIKEFATNVSAIGLMDVKVDIDCDFSSADIFLYVDKYIYEEPNDHTEKYLKGDLFKSYNIVSINYIIVK